MRGRFLLSLGFAAVASLALIPWLLATTNLVGFDLALGSFATCLTAAYLFLIAPRPSLGIQAAWMAGAGSGLAWLLIPGRPAKILALLLILGLIRSGWLYRRSPARSVLTELCLALSGLGLAWMLAGAPMLSWALACWGFLLVQSLYFLIADIEARSEEAAEDAFENAHQRAMRLLEQTGG